MSESADLRVVIGENVKRLRHDRGLTLEHMARTSRTSLGLPWSESTVADIEAGKRSPTLPTLLALAAILGTGEPPRPVRLAELLTAGEGQRFALTARVSVPVEDARSAVSGELVELHPISPNDAAAIERGIRSMSRSVRRATDRVPGEVTLGELSQAEESVSLPERRAARTLGVPALTVALLSHRLWGHGFTRERDRRAGEEASAQKRGRVTRELVAELTGELVCPESGGDSGEH